MSINLGLIITLIKNAMLHCLKIIENKLIDIFSTASTAKSIRDEN